MQMLFHGAKNGETVIYMTGIAEPVFMIKKFMSNFSFYDSSLIENSKIQFWDLGSSIQTMGTKKALDAITDIVRETNASRVIIDPLPLAQLFSSISDYRKYLYDFLTALRNLQVFTIIIGEKSENDNSDIESYMVDAVIVLYLRPLDNPLVYKNLLRIRKMRGTNHTRDMMAMDITSEGMRVYRMG